MSAKILLLDIETAPSVGYVWGKYDQNVIEFLEDWYILSFAYQWLEDTAVTVKSLRQYKGYRPAGSDKKLMSDLWPLLDAADIVVAHNGDAFDIKKVNTRFLYHEFDPYSDFKTFDTLKNLRKTFKLDSNKLNDAAKFLGLEGKISHTGFSLWKGCMGGDEEAWAIMEKYNAQDVALLKEIYLRMRPWCNHPDVTIYDDTKPNSDKPSCPTCNSHSTQRRGIAVARTRRYQRWNCRSCGTWFQGKSWKGSVDYADVTDE